MAGIIAKKAAKNIAIKPPSVPKITPQIAIIGISPSPKAFLIF